MNTDVTCVINAHREGHTLFPTIKSIKRTQAYSSQCGLNTNIHVVLDRSDDITREIVERELGNHADVTEVDFGDLSYSRNLAVEQSTAKYMAFVDGDDLWGKSWLVDSFALAERSSKSVVYHPEYNIFFGGENNHVFQHVDMDSEDFELVSLYQMNYWTALSFSKTEIYKKHPYKKNTVLDGFGYEDWTWNAETIADGIKHKVVPGTIHFIRKGRAEQSLLAFTNRNKALPRILTIYANEANQPMRVAA